jgi:hypothetical protein
MPLLVWQNVTVKLQEPLTCFYCLRNEIPQLNVWQCMSTPKQLLLVMFHHEFIRLTKPDLIHRITQVTIKLTRYNFIYKCVTMGSQRICPMQKTKIVKNKNAIGT